MRGVRGRHLRTDNPSAGLIRQFGREIAARGRIAFSREYVLVRRGTGGVLPDGTTNHEPTLASEYAPLSRVTGSWRCDWEPDEFQPAEEGCPYCAGRMCARLDGLGCTHDREERHG